MGDTLAREKRLEELATIGLRDEILAKGIDPESIIVRLTTNAERAVDPDKKWTYCNPSPSDIEDIYQWTWWYPRIQSR